MCVQKKGKIQAKRDIEKERQRGRENNVLLAKKKLTLMIKVCLIQEEGDIVTDMERGERKTESKVT